MSKPRYDWWGYVKGMIRRYPALCDEYGDLHSQSLTAAYSGMPRGEGGGRSIERAAIRELPAVKQREYEAVKGAIILTTHGDTGRERLRLIALVYWKRTHTLRGAAIECHVSYITAKRWHGEFIRCVAALYGLID